MSTTEQLQHQREVLHDHEAMVNNEPRVFTEADFPVGSVSHQGDVILVRVPRMPESVKPRKSRQIAEGNTQGSRHILEGGEIFDCDSEDLAALIKEVTGKQVDAKYMGPVFRGGNLTHPQHGNQAFPKDACVGSVYQRNLDAEEREARVQD